jgi:parallel beta-helix repeat protein
MRSWLTLTTLATITLAACDLAGTPTEPAENPPQFGVSPVPPGAFVVNDGGADCPAGAIATHATISAAVAAAPEFSTIYVCPGNYLEIVEIDKVLWVFGPQHDVDARTRGGEPEAVVGTAGGAFRVRSSQVQIKGFTIAGATGAAGVDVDAATTTTLIANNIIEGNTFGIYLNSAGPTASFVFQNAIRDNNAPGAHSGHGIYADQGTIHVNITQNVFAGHAAGATRFEGPAGSQSRINVVANTLENEAPMTFFRASDVYFEANSILDAASDGIVLGGGTAGVGVYYNRFLGGAGSAIRVTDGGSGANSGLVIVESCFVGNAWAVHIDAAAHNGGIYAEGSWWGQAGGPDVNGAGPGAGDAIRDPDGLIDYSPWQTIAPPECGALDDEGPVTSNVTASANPVPIGAGFQLSALVDDAKTGGSTIASAEYAVNGGVWTGLGASDGAFNATAESVSGSLVAPPAPAVLTICVRGTDAAGNTGSAACTVVAVYDASAGFVTGGGWIASPAGACLITGECASAEGRATFGFVARYQKGATAPIGATQFLFHAGEFHFSSTSYDWLVVAGPRAQFKGWGTVNDGGDYGFILTAIDGDVSGGGGADRLRLKVWERATGTLVYDNQLGDDDDVLPSVGLGGGSIVVHTK